MARSKRKTMAQEVVSTAAIGLPAPVRSVVATRWGAPLAIAIVLGLLGTGVATVNWDGWVPHLKIDRQRAAEVRETIQEEVHTLASKAGEPAQPEQRPVEKLGEEMKQIFAGQPTPPEPPRPIDKLGTEVKQLGARIFKDSSR